MVYLFILPCLWFILWCRNFKFWCKCSQIHSSFPQILQTGSSVILLLITFLQPTPQGQPSLLKNFLFSSCTFFFFFGCTMWHEGSSLIRDQTCVACIGSTELTTGLPEKSCSFFFKHVHVLMRAFPAAQVVKNLPDNAGDAGSIPGSRRSPGGGNDNALQYSCLENPVERRACWATVCRVARSQTRLSN